MKNIWQTQKDFTIWRYMKLSHFKELVTESLFYFSNPNDFEDRREFGVPKQWLEKDFWKPIIEEKNKNLAEEGVNIDELAENFIFSLTDFYHSKDRFGVSCWYAAKSESELMWRANKNPRSNEDGVIAIKSSAKRFFAAFDENIRNYNMLLGRVNYVNYDNFKRSDFAKTKIFHCGYDGFFLRSQWDNDVTPIFYKRQLFRDERECRVVIEVKNKNRKLPVDLDSLIEEVVIHPEFYENKESEELKAILRDKKIKFRKSSIADSEPIKAKRNLFKKREDFEAKVKKESMEGGALLLEFEDKNQFEKWSRVVNKKMGFPKFTRVVFGVSLIGRTNNWSNPEGNKSESNEKILASGTKSLVFIKNQKIFLSKEDAKKAGYFYREDEMELLTEPHLIEWGLKK